MAENEKANNSNILKKVMGSQQKIALREFNPQQLVLQHLGNLTEREIEIIAARYGLKDGQDQTLEYIGKRLSLTRERVRQIEKDGLKKLRKIPFPEGLEKGIDLIFQIIEEHGSIMREADLLNTIAIGGSEITRHSILFLLNVSPPFSLLKENDETYQSWCLATFDKDIFDRIIAGARETAQEAKNPLASPQLFERLRSRNILPPDQPLSDEALESMIAISKALDKNPFNEWGLVEWLAIHPKDVGDKAFLVLEHHGTPEHYSKITELINKQKFDKRVAYMETVHNELIKDDRFVLIGRGIYALTKWGYEKGTVGEVIEAILRKVGHPLSKEEIVNEVMKRRMVKKNTILVGLANKKKFRRNAENKYILNDNVG